MAIARIFNLGHWANFTTEEANGKVVLHTTVGKSFSFFETPYYFWRGDSASITAWTMCLHQVQFSSKYLVELPWLPAPDQGQQTAARRLTWTIPGFCEHTFSGTHHLVLYVSLLLIEALRTDNRDPETAGPAKPKVLVLWPSTEIVCQCLNYTDENT